MLKRMPVVLIALFTSLSGCATDSSLAPPPDSEKITVTVKVPEALEAETMLVMYRSATCKHHRRGAYGELQEMDGHNAIEMQPQRVGQSDLYEVKIPMDGGGQCKWHLGSVTFGVKYADPTQFGENVTYGAGGGVVVIFDYNDSPRGGADISVDGNLAIKEDYYPWVDEDNLGQYQKTADLSGEGDIYLMFKALQARKVYFEPVLHSDYVVYSVGPKVKKEGNYVVFTYPDGSVQSDRRTEPDFRKLQAIRLAAEGKQ